MDIVPYAVPASRPGGATVYAVYIDDRLNGLEPVPVYADRRHGPRVV